MTKDEFYKTLELNKDVLGIPKEINEYDDGYDIRYNFQGFNFCVYNGKLESINIYDKNYETNDTKFIC